MNHIDGYNYFCAKFSDMLEDTERKENAHECLPCCSQMSSREEHDQCFSHVSASHKESVTFFNLTFQLSMTIPKKRRGFIESSNVLDAKVTHLFCLEEWCASVLCKGIHNKQDIIFKRQRKFSSICTDTNATCTTMDYHNSEINVFSPRLPM